MTPGRGALCTRVKVGTTPNILAREHSRTPFEKGEVWGHPQTLAASSSRTPLCLLFAQYLATFVLNLHELWYNRHGPASGSVGYSAEKSITGHNQRRESQAHDVTALTEQHQRQSAEVVCHAYLVSCPGACAVS